MILVMRAPTQSSLVALLFAITLLAQPHQALAFSLATSSSLPSILPVSTSTSRSRCRRADLRCRNEDNSSAMESKMSNADRRRFLVQSAAAAAVAAVVTVGGPTLPAWGATTSDTAVEVEMKLFVDPQGLFILQLPKRFFVLRRTAKGDLPDETTGLGRRGSSIFNAGDLAKAEVLAIERFPTRILLEENGIVPTGSLKTFSDLGSPSTIAKFITLRRDRDKPGGTTNTQIVPNSVVVSNDGLDLSFQLRTTIDVQKPELLMEQYGIRELFRITAAKASLRSMDGNLLAIFASALEQDWQGSDGAALQQAVVSFQAIDRSNTERSAS